MIPSLLIVVAVEMISVAQGSRPTPPMPSVVEPLSADALAAVQRFEQSVTTERATFDALPLPDDVRSNLAVRVALEQAMRRAVDPAIAPLAAADRMAASTAIWRRIATVDTANTAYVKSILPSEGWFRSRRDGDDVTRDAWLIVQHSPDQAFQRSVLARMRPLVKTGDVRGADYALLYDRTEMFAGRLQLYGSQMTCVAGHWSLASTIDPPGLDRRRAEMGLPPTVEYLKNFRDRC